MSPKETLLDVGRLFVRTGKSKDRKMSLAAPDGAGLSFIAREFVTFC